MDDLFYYISRSQDDVSKAESQIQAFINSLPKSLILEPDPNISNGFKFLESYISFKDKFIAYYSENFNDGIVFATDLTTYPFQTFKGSYMMNPEQEIKNNIRNRLDAIERYSLNEYSIYIAMISSFCDFYCSNYPYIHSYIQNLPGKKIGPNLLPLNKVIFFGRVFPKTQQT